MRKHSLITLILILLFIVLVRGSPILADDNLSKYGNNSLQATITKLDANHPDVIDAQSYDFKRMKATQDPQTKEMTSLKWVTRTQMASSTTGIKYCTIAYEFQLAGYIAIWDATPFRKATVGAPGEVMYHSVEISRNTFVQIYARNARVSEQTIEDALAREDVIDVRAYIQIYNDKNGNGQVDQGEQISMIMGNESEIETKAAMFPYEDRQDMHSRFQQVKIHFIGKPRSDFYSTPEGSTQWQESYKTCAKRYSGKSGTRIKIPITLRNSGAAATTNFGASWWGSGWTNPVIPAQNVTLVESGNKAFSFNVTVPAQGKETRLVFRCNIDGNAPANEINKDNNITIIEVTSNGLPGTPPGSAEDSKAGYIAVVPCTKTIFTGDFYEFKAYYHKPDGSCPEITQQASWDASDNNIIHLESAKGKVKALKPGSVVLSASYNGLKGIADIMVIDEPMPPTPNYSPEADFTISNPNPVEDEEVSLSDCSKHPGKAYGERIVSYSWEIEGQSNMEGEEVCASWKAVGTYKVKLTVTDQDGDTDSCIKSVVVGPALPAAVITLSKDEIILGREIHIDGDQSTAAGGRTIMMDDMAWEIYNPSGQKVAYTTSGSKLFNDEKDLTNSIINKTGVWRVRLKVKDSSNNESEWTEKSFRVYPDNPPVADFWVAQEAIRYSYQGYNLKVSDISTPGNPDVYLGDEIYERNWKLYYDTNNDGICTGPEDEIINPGDKGKAAEIIQVSSNDPRPTLQFAKTGRYQLELSVKERHEAWGEIIDGLSADTTGKSIEEKQTIVINIAPAVAFDIKKKIPVDIQFAVDISVPDAKYNSLQSGIASFTSKLIGGYVKPSIGLNRGDKESMVNSGQATCLNDDYYGVTGAEYVYVNDTTTPGYANFLRYKHNFFGDPVNQAWYSLNEAGDISGAKDDAIALEKEYRYAGETITYSSSSGGLTIVAARGNLSIYRNGSLLTSTSVPMTNLPPDKYKDGPFYAGNWGDNKTIVLYHNILASGSNASYCYMYIVDNLSGAISNSKTFTGIFRDEYLDSNFKGINYLIVTRLGKELLGISSSIFWYTDDWYPYQKYSIINTNLDYKHIDTSNANDNKYVYFSKLSDYVFETITVKGKSKPVDTHAVYHSAGYNTGLTIPTLAAGSPDSTYYGQSSDTTAYRVVYPDGDFTFIKSVNDGKGNITNALYYYDKYGTYKWSVSLGSNLFRIPTAKYICSASVSWRVNSYYRQADNWFLNKFVVGETSGHTLLRNMNTGQVVYDLPYALVGHTKDLLIARDKDDASGNSHLLVFANEKGLNYVNNVINKHAWDSANGNFIVSVIENAYSDYSNKDKLIKNLEANKVTFAAISPSAAQSQVAEITKYQSGDWWINTSSNMSVPLDQLADKIIQSVNEERGADNIVLVNQEVDLRAVYSDPEKDKPGELQWKFIQDPTTLSGMDISNCQGYSAKHNTTQTVNPSPADDSFATLVAQFDKAGTWKIYCKAKDNPDTTAAYMIHPKAGSKWSNEDAYLTVIVHRKPVAQFTVISSTSNKPGNQLGIQDQSYDPDLQYTDPMNMKGLRIWEWQYRKAGGTWETECCYDNSGPRGFKISGNYELRLRVQDNFGAWSDWTNTTPITIINRPPVADFSVIPNPVAVNHAATITDLSSDPDGDPIISYNWVIETSPGVTEQFTRVNPASFPYTWSAAGTYQVTLTVTDSEGLSSSVSKQVQVIQNNPPVAVITLPSEVFVDEWFVASGKSSYDPDGDALVRAYWQYLKPGSIEWTPVHIQELAGPFTIPGESFLRYPIYPADGEQGQWRIRLAVEDSKGLCSEITEEIFTVQDGWEITGQIIPRIGERARKMIITGYAHRKGVPDKYQIDSMTAYLIYLDASCSSSGKPAGESIEALTMVYDSALDDFQVTCTVPEHVSKTRRWPADGSYYVKIVGVKGTTTKETAAPFDVKGNVKQRLYIQTRSW